MTNAPAVIQATYADWRTVKTRKLLQIIFEVPIEQQAHVLSVLGAPLGDSATWVAIARLQAPTAPPERAPEPPDPQEPPPACTDRNSCARHGLCMYISRPCTSWRKPEPKPRNPDAADRARASYRADNEMGKAARLAGMLRKDPEYQEWLAELVHGHHAPSDPTYLGLVAIRQHGRLNVDSCSEIAVDQYAFERWKQHLLAFEQAVGRAARPS